MRRGVLITTTCSMLATMLLGVQPPVARADVIANARGPYATQIVGCTGDLIVVEGEVHALIRLSQDNNGVVHLGAHLDFNAEGTDTNGTAYLYVGEANSEMNAQPGAATEITVVITGHLVSQGPAENGTVRLVGHLTVTPDGEVAVRFVKMEAVCQ
jgi:hypothetical protein